MIESSQLEPNNKRMSRLSVISNNHEENKLIEEMTTTSFEKVLIILKTTKELLEDLNVKHQYIKDIQWVIKKISSHTLYSYEVPEDSNKDINDDNTSIQEVKKIYEYLHNYSEIKHFTRKPKESKVKKVFRTSIVSNYDKNQLLRSLTITKKEQDKTPVLKKISEINEFDFEEKEKIPMKLDDIDLTVLNKLNFDIFAFENQVSRERVYPIIGKHTFKESDTLDILDSRALDPFLQVTRDKYKEVPYHNSVHAADVCQNILIIFSLGNLIEILHLSQIDVVAFITACLLHDIGHPSTNNNFHINSSSEYAITYNDKSVLENYHASEAFRVIRNQETNIFSKFSLSEYRNVRKRITELILSTDMIYHAKILSIVKNRLSMNFISRGFNASNLINAESQNLFEEQQEIMNFLIHTCDIAHSAKNFEISYKWTYLIMNEFWNQGDLEKEMGITVSFLCDRNVADVPRGQIVFIKGIILPNFEVLCDISVELDEYMDNIQNNLNSWLKIVEDEKSKKEKETQN